MSTGLLDPNASNSESHLDTGTHPGVRASRGPAITVDSIRKAADDGVFISYSRPDELFALDLALGLHNAGINTWLDTLQVPDDSDWNAAVSAAMKACGLMLAVFSPRALMDRQVVAERERFAASGKLLLPVIHQRCDLSRLGDWLEPIDFSHDFDRGLYMVARLLGVQSPHTLA